MEEDVWGFFVVSNNISWNWTVDSSDDVQGFFVIYNDIFWNWVVDDYEPEN